jgi:hypothetical protein
MSATTIIVSVCLAGVVLLGIALVQNRGAFSGKGPKRWQAERTSTPLSNIDVTATETTPGPCHHKAHHTHHHSGDHHFGDHHFGGHHFGGHHFGGHHAGGGDFGSGHGGFGGGGGGHH